MQGVVNRGNTIETTVFVKANDQYEEKVLLSINTQPVGISATLKTTNQKVPFNTTLTIATSSTATIGDYEIIITARGANDREYNCTYGLSVKSESIPLPSESELVVTDLFYASGWMGDWGDITLDTGYSSNVHSSPLCIKITYSADGSQGNDWAGIYWQYPTNNWGDKTGGRDLTSVTKLTFWARGQLGGEKGEFKVGESKEIPRLYSTSHIYRSCNADKRVATIHNRLIRKRFDTYSWWILLDDKRRSKSTGLHFLLRRH